jgi:hypothetical protein
MLDEACGARLRLWITCANEDAVKNALRPARSLRLLVRCTNASIDRTQYQRNQELPDQEGPYRVPRHARSCHVTVSPASCCEVKVEEVDSEHARQVAYVQFGSSEAA